MHQHQICNACETVAHCTKHGCIPARPGNGDAALRHAATIEHWAKHDNGLRGQELRAAAAEMRRMHAALYLAAGQEGATR